MAGKRILVLAHDAWSPRGAKTGQALVRYARNGWSGDSVVGIVDRATAGRDSGDVVGEFARGIPVFESVVDALEHCRADVLSIGIAPVGGALPDAWRADLRAALEGGLRVVSGLHLFLADDPEFARYRERIWDVRRHAKPKRIATGEGALVRPWVVTTVGTDTSSGKMTTSIELVREARRRGLRAAFVATGQTGMMVGCDAGCPADAITSDFVAGAVEECVLDAAETDPAFIFVEGQGALSHAAYSGVTLALLHGSFPDFLVMCHEPSRTLVSAFAKGPVPFKLHPLADEIRLNEALLAPTTGGTCVAVSLMMPGADAAQAAEKIASIEKETGLPGADVLTGGAPKLLDAILTAAKRRGTKRRG